MFGRRVNDADEFSALVQLIQTEQPELFLYHSTTCGYCYRVRRVIDRLKAPVQLRDIDEQPQWRDELIAARQRGTVPVLKLDVQGQPLWLPESSDIAELLEVAFSKPRR